MQGLRRWPLASALHLRPTDREFESIDQHPTAKLHEPNTKNRKDLRGNRWRCFAADLRQRVPATSGSSAHLPNNQPESPQERRCSRT